MPQCWQRFRKIGPVVAVVFLSISLTAAAGDPAVDRRLQETIAKVRTATSVQHDAALQNLLKQIMGVDPETVDAKTVHELVSLLSSPDYEVREVGTIALGQLGRKAGHPNSIINRGLEKAIASARAGKSLDERVQRNVCAICKLGSIRNTLRTKQ